MRRLLLLATLGTLGTLGACTGAAEREVETVVRRDSMGIQLVESHASLMTDAELSAALASAPALEIGEADGDAPYMLHRVVGASRLDDG